MRARLSFRSGAQDCEQISFASARRRGAGSLTRALPLCFYLHAQILRLAPVSRPLHLNDAGLLFHCHPLPLCRKMRLLGMNLAARRHGASASIPIRGRGESRHPVFGSRNGGRDVGETREVKAMQAKFFATRHGGKLALAIFFLRNQDSVWDSLAVVDIRYPFVVGAAALSGPLRGLSCSRRRPCPRS